MPRGLHRSGTCGRERALSALQRLPAQSSSDEHEHGRNRVARAPRSAPRRRLRMISLETRARSSAPAVSRHSRCGTQAATNANCWIPQTCGRNPRPARAGPSTVTDRYSGLRPGWCGRAVDEPRRRCGRRLKTRLTAPSIMLCAASDKHHPALRALVDLLPGRCPLSEGAPGLAHREHPDGFPARHCSHWRAGARQRPRSRGARRHRQGVSL